jgi:hypothetical protein
MAVIGNGSAPGALPRTYAFLLKCYPRRWRADGRGEELLAVLLDAAEAAGRLRPTIADCWDVGTHGLVERLRRGCRLMSDDVRLRIAQVSVIVGAALAVFFVLFGELRIPQLSDGVTPNHLDEFLRQGGSPFLTVGVAAYAAWFAVLASYLLGAIRPCRELALISVGLVLLAPSLGVLTGHQRPPGGLLAAMAVLGMGAAVTPVRTRPTVARRVVTSVAVLGLLAALISWRLLALRHVPPGFARSWFMSRPMFYWNPNGDYLQINRALAVPGTWLVLVATLLAIGRSYWSRVWLPVAAFSFVPLMCLRLGTATFSSGHTHRDVLVWSCAAAGLLLLNAVLARRLLTSRRILRGRDRGHATPARLRLHGHLN